MKLFDSHAHYEDAMFDLDRFSRLDALKNSEVEYILNCCSDVHVIPTVLEIVNHCDFAYGSVGVHPHWVLETPENYLDIIAKAAQNKKIVALGEMGLDYFFSEPKDLQKHIFRSQLALAKDLNMPVIIHDRDAHEDTLEILQEYQPKGVLHRYSGPVDLLQKAFSFGMYVSFNNDLTYPAWNAGPIACLMATPWDRLLIETDCPYAPPFERQNDRCESKDVKRVVQEIARLRNVSEEFVAQISLENAKRVYEINI